MCEEVQRFEDLLMQQRELFAEEEIRASFPKLITFVLAVRSAVLSAFCLEFLYGSRGKREAAFGVFARCFPLSYNIIWILLCVDGEADERCCGDGLWGRQSGRE